MYLSKRYGAQSSVLKLHQKYLFALTYNDDYDELMMMKMMLKLEDHSDYHIIHDTAQQLGASVHGRADFKAAKTESG